MKTRTPFTGGWLLVWGLIAGLLLGVPFPARGSGRDDPQSGLLGWWRFDEGSGVYSEDGAGITGEAELQNVVWVRGDFGTALKFTGSNSYVTLPPIPQLDGSDAMTVSAWVYWEDTGQYPNILTGGTWSPGGFLIFVNRQVCSFRMGRPGHRHGVAEEAWTEVSAPLLSDIPLRRWVHVAAVFERPEIRTYVNGRQVGRADWDYPVGQTGDLQIGRWGTAASHTGLIDDVRIYGRALTADEVLAVADPQGRESDRYQEIGPAEVVAEEVLTLETRWARMVIGDNGMVLSLEEKGTGRELLAAPRPILSIRQRESARPRHARRLRRRGDRLVVDFPRDLGHAALSVRATADYFVVTALELDVEEVEQFTFFQISPAPHEYVGVMAGLASDDESGVCLRSLALEVDTAFHGRPPHFRAWTTAEHGLTGHSIGLAAGPRERLPAMLQAMAETEAVPQSEHGGPWAMESEATRGSYLFADLAKRDTDDWIQLAHRGGFTNLHLHGWWTTLGHYEPRRDWFPAGLDDLRATIERIRAAGLSAGLHTLTACISTRDPWVTPDPHPDLIAHHEYTLARPLSDSDTEVYVEEMPAADHDVVWSYSGNGNVLRIGNELIRYEAISRTPPYAFLQCERGAFATGAESHAAGDAVDYLQQRYLAFYPDPKSRLAEQLAERLARVYNESGAQMLYFDGSEGMRSRYGIDALRWGIFRRLDGGVSEASCHGHNNWWFHSRLGAWDHPVWAMKPFHDEHIRIASRYRRTDLLEPQLGWWAPRGPTAIARGHFPDEMEYFAAKNLGLDAAMSIQGVNVSRRPPNARMEEQLTILGWYERLRLARYFDASTIGRVAEPGAEFRLRPTRDGHWQFQPADLAKHRISRLGNGSESWTGENPFADQPLRLRLEALYSVAPYEDPEATPLADFADLEQLDNRQSAPGVTSALSLETREVRAGGRSLRFQASNDNDTSRGAWTQIGTTYEHPYLSMLPGDAMGLWVKGDGSGALLNVQIVSPREFHHCLADHYIDLDFTGWRYVELLLRERDSERLSDYVWPYSGAGGAHAIYRNPVNRARISQVNLLLNEIPAGGQVDILVSPIQSLPTRSVELVHPAVQVNGRRVVFPVRLTSGQYLEWEGPEGGVVYDERGELLQRFSLDGELPRLAAGANRLEFDCEPPAGASARAEITLVALGEPFGQPRDPAEIDWNRLDRKFDLPRIVTRIDGTDNVWHMVRCAGPADKPAPRLQLELRVDPVLGGPGDADADPLDTPMLTIGERTVRFPVTLGPGQRLICRDQSTWTVLGPDNAIVAEGLIAGDFPVIDPGTNPVRLNFENAPDTFRATVLADRKYER